ncbi:MAG: tRNA(Glu)-specific nuclease WapA [Pseudidiomarina mangrovi]|nr:MAG: tRNA(Glu)-specific nuclease WapA [Pseudidiomarina mangrovi]
MHLVSGSYGAAGSTYRLNGQPGTLITAHGGSLANGPDYFERVTKAKEVSYFGNAFYATGLSSDAAAVTKPGNNSVVSAWMMSSVEDVARNYIQYLYTTNNLSGESYLSEIRYSGNHTTGELPYIRIIFDHVAKAQPRNGYQAGYPITQSQQLQAIRVLVDEQLWRSYQLSYLEPLYANDKLMLQAIEECALDVHGFTQCKPELSFSWHTGSPANGLYFNPYNNTQLSFAANDFAGLSKVFDITGDGIDDLIYLSDGAWRYRVGPYFASEFWLSDLSVDHPQEAMVMDVNGDGTRELLVVNLADQWLAIGAGNVNFAINRAAIGADGLARIMDIDGDAAEDIVFMQQNKIYVYFNQGSNGFSAAVELYAFNDVHTQAQLQAQTRHSAGWLNDSSALDIDGDGRSDMVIPTTTAVTQCIRNGQILAEILSGIECSDVGGSWQTYDYKTLDVFRSELTAQGPQLARVQSWPMPNKGLRVADFNGDGLSDIAYVINNEWRYRISNGTTFGDELSTGLAASDVELTAATLFLDVDNDGRTDILHANTATTWRVYLAQLDSATGIVGFVERGLRGRVDSEIMIGGLLTADMRADLLIAKDGTWHLYAKDAGQITDVIDSYTTSFGVQTNIEYAPLSDSSVYVASNPLVTASADVVALQGHVPVVARVSNAVSTLDSVAVSYRYGGLAVHKQGLGALGFAWLETTDEQTGVVTTSSYYQSIDSQDHVLNGMPLVTEQRLGTALLSRSENQLATAAAHHGGRFGFISRSIEANYQYTSAGQAVLRATQTTDTSYDSYGNVLSLATVTDDAYSGASKQMSTVNTYSDARFGRLATTTVTRSRSDDATLFVRESNFSYRADGLLVETVVSPNDPSYRLQSNYEYDAYGQKIATHVSGIAEPNSPVQTRSSWVGYAQQGRYVAYQENHLGHRVSYQYNGVSAAQASGVVYQLSETNANGESGQQWFDAFGQVTSQQGSDGVLTTTSRSWCTGCEPGSLFVEQQSTAGQPERKTYFDAWGRAVAQAQQGFDGAWVVVYTRYDAQGRAYEVTEPNSTLTTTTVYDALGRVAQVTNPLGHTSSIEIGADYTRSINPKGQDSVEYSNGFGETVRTVDHLGGEVLFHYDAAGQLVQTTVVASGGQLDSLYVLYDTWGHKIAMNDPVKGTWSYTYNAFGELIAQQSAHGATQVLQYDELGRKVRSYQPDVGTRCWYYGTSSSNHNLGRLQRVSMHHDVAVDCSTSRQSEHEQQLSYDSAGRIAAQLTRIDGVAYVESYTYDMHGRLATTSYPTGTAAVSVRHEYNSFGYADKLVRVETNAILKTIEATNNQGQVTSISYQGGQQASRSYNVLGWLTYTSMRNSYAEWNAVSLSHDVLGNVTSRLSAFERPNGASSQVDESFSYDGLNRLRSTQQSFTDTHMGVTHSTSSTVEQRYDGYGNITYRTGVGDYNYATDGSMRLLSISAPVEDDPIIIDPPPGPCCVSGFSFEPTPIDGPIEAPSPLYLFKYDASGNVKSDGTRSFTYDGADRVIAMSMAGNSSTMRYDAQGGLYYQHDVFTEDNQSVSYTKHMAGGFEKKTRSGGAGALTEYRYTVADDVVIVQRDSTTTSSEATYFLFKDHLGSVFTTLASTGAIISQQVFSAFGQTRSIHTSSALSLGLMMAPTEQGFTGHRQMDALGIVHMKGRIYDPTIGRFLQADPFIQAPKNSQNYNRYSYVLNNPLRYTDPSGYNFFEKILRPFKQITRSIFKALGPKISSWVVAIGSAFCGPFYAACAAAGTYDVARAHGASSSGALRSALAAGAMAYVGQKANAKWGAGEWKAISAQAVAGGVTASLNGGNFGHGFWAAGFNAFQQGPNSGASYGTELSGWGDYASSLGYHLTTSYAQDEMSRFARKNGMSLTALNILLTLNSVVGNKIAGSRYNESADEIGGFTSRKDSAIGIFWDINDTLLGYQGLLDGSGLHYITVNQPNFERTISSCHSLGTLTCNNLVARGYAASANLNSVPFGNVAYGNNQQQAQLGQWDAVNGFIFGRLLNWGASSTRCTHFDDAFCHGKRNYR